MSNNQSKPTKKRNTVKNASKRKASSQRFDTGSSTQSKQRSDHQTQNNNEEYDNEKALQSALDLPDELFEKNASEDTPVRRNSMPTRPLSADDDIEDFAQVNYLEVTRHQHNQRLDNFLLGRLKGLPRPHIYKMIRSDEVRVNNKRCKPQDKLERGDIVRIGPVRLATREKPIISKDFAQSLLERVVYEDDGLIVLNKPSGIAVHGGSGQDFGVIEAMREVTGKKYLELIHRIDKDTSGLLMISKKRSTLKKLQVELRDRTIQKQYLCIAQGQPVLDDIQTDAPLLRYTLASGERRVKVDYKNADAKDSQTNFKVITRFKLDGQPVSLIEATPLTGRTHQIRVHLAHLGHPILGDDKYFADDKSAVRRLCLHAWRLRIEGYPLIEAPLPEDMDNLLPSLSSSVVHDVTGIDSAESDDKSSDSDNNDADNSTDSDNNNDNDAE